MSDNLILVGTGLMAGEYAKVLLAEKIPFTAVGRGEASAAKFEEKWGVHPVCGGCEEYLKNHPAPESAIVAVGVEALEGVIRQLLQHGCRRILVEKPGGISRTGMLANVELAKKCGAAVLVAYNRRFYNSTIQARRIIEEDGGIRCVAFDFTEWSHRLCNIVKGPGVMDFWFCANSTHVVDLAFYLAGAPEKIDCFHSGSLNWHHASAIFAGAGVTKRGALFSYRADWASAGRWSVIAYTPRRSLILCPMEQLQEQLVGSIQINPIALQDNDDIDFKPGLKKQVAAFLNGEWGEFCTLEEQYDMMKVYCEMAGYDFQA